MRLGEEAILALLLLNEGGPGGGKELKSLFVWLLAVSSFPELVPQCLSCMQPLPGPEPVLC